MMCMCKDRRGWEERFPHQNWPIILGLVVILNTAYSIFTPSIYQLITTPRSDSDEEEISREEDSGRFWPGLGGSDTLYAWVLTSYSIAETASMPVAGIMAEKIPYTISILFLCALYTAGGILYGLGAEVWMIIAGRALMGSGAAFADVIASSYIGEMGTRMDELREREGKRPMKPALYIAYSFTMNGVFIMTFGITSIMAQFQNVNPYYWPGWFVAALAVAYAAFVMLTFTETRPFSRLKSCTACDGWTGIKLSLQLRSKWKMHLTLYIFLIACGYMIGQLYAILATLVTPTLSDQFGFNVEYTSYYLVGTGVAFLIASFIQLGTKSLKLDNRSLLGIAFTVALIGSVLMGDWQAIGQDPCTTGIDYDAISSEHMNATSNSSLYQQWLESCEALSNSSHQCFWNPKSRITGEFCNTCLRTCLSEQKSTNFYQFSLGVLLVSLTAPLCFVYIPAITSAITSVESQGTVMSLVIGGGALARGISPSWLVESYSLSNNHTYISMGVTVVFLAAILLSLLALYNKLAPKPTRTQEELTRHTSVNFLSILDAQRHSPELTVRVLAVAGANALSSLPEEEEEDCVSNKDFEDTGEPYHEFMYETTV